LGIYAQVNPRDEEQLELEVLDRLLEEDVANREICLCVSLQ